VKEGLIDADRFVPMFGMYGLAEAVNTLCEKPGSMGVTVKTSRPTRWAIASANSLRRLLKTRR
jgi:hypothetical protein